MDANDVVMGWPELPEDMPQVLQITFIAVERDGNDTLEFWCPGEPEKQRMKELGFPSEAIWTKEELADRLARKCSENG